MDPRVFAVKCSEYNQVGTKMDKLIAMMGGMDAYATAGERIALKVNLLLAAGPEKAVTTHPTLAASVAGMLKSLGAEPFIVDSPGSGYKYDPKTLDKTYRISGMKQMADEIGLELNLDCSHEEIGFPEGELIKRFEVISPVLKADAVFNLCKLKTHTFTYMTGAVKNHFGVIPGLAKPGYHAKLNDTHRFCAMLLDLAKLVGARLFIMDAVTAMEGEGPFAGQPRSVGLLLASTNPVALDAVAAEIIGLDRDQNPLLVEAEKRGWGPNRVEDVELIGVDRGELRVPNFKTPATYFGGTGMGRMKLHHRIMAPFFKDGFSVKPKVNNKVCIACGVCAKACPVEAISIVEKKHAFIDNDKCIRCYCCHEMCPEHAVELKRGFMYRLLKPTGASGTRGAGAHSG